MKIIKHFAGTANDGGNIRGWNIVGASSNYNNIVVFSCDFRKSRGNVFDLTTWKTFATHIKIIVVDCIAKATHQWWADDGHLNSSAFSSTTTSVRCVLRLPVPRRQCRLPRRGISVRLRCALKVHVKGFVCHIVLQGGKTIAAGYRRDLPCCTGITVSGNGRWLTRLHVDRGITHFCF